MQKSWRGNKKQRRRNKKARWSAGLLLCGAWLRCVSPASRNLCRSHGAARRERHSEFNCRGLRRLVFAVSWAARVTAANAMVLWVTIKRRPAVAELDRPLRAWWRICFAARVRLRCAAVVLARDLRDCGVCWHVLLVLVPAYGYWSDGALVSCLAPQCQPAAPCRSRRHAAP